MKVSRRRLGLVLGDCSLLAMASPRNSAAPPMADAARHFLASLTPEQRRAAAFRFDDDERYFWHYIPADDIPKRYQRPRKGAALKDLSREQSQYAYAMLSTGLSPRGFQKAVQIMALEEILKALEQSPGDRRHSGKYFFSIFGEPSPTGTWGYRVEGHHLSLHYTIANGKVTGSPTFFGANPHEVRLEPHRGLRILAAEEDKARELMAALTPAQKRTAIVSPTAYPDILTGASREAALQGQPAGLAAAKMTVRQRELLARLLGEYADNLAAPLAEARRAQIRQAGASLHLAWAGSEERGGPHYYRIQAPEFLVEYDNTQNRANHVHSVWRDFRGDWGRDLLQEHYAASHARPGAASHQAP